MPELSPEEVAVISSSLMKLATVRKNLRSIKDIGAYNLQETLDSSINGFRLYLCDHGIDPFQH